MSRAKSVGYPPCTALLWSVNRWNSEVDVVFGSVDIAGGIYSGVPLFEVGTVRVTVFHCVEILC